MAKKLTFDERNDIRNCAIIGLGILNAVTLGGLSPIVVPVQVILIEKTMKDTADEEKVENDKKRWHKERWTKNRSILDEEYRKEQARKIDEKVVGFK